MARLKVNKMEGQLLRIKELERERHANHFHLLRWHLLGSLSLCSRTRGRLKRTELNVAFIYSDIFVVAFSTIWALLSSGPSIRFQRLLWMFDNFFLFSPETSSHIGHHQNGWKGQGLLNSVNQGDNNARPEPRTGSHNSTKCSLVIAVRTAPETRSICRGTKRRTERERKERMRGEDSTWQRPETGPLREVPPQSVRATRVDTKNRNHCSQFQSGWENQLSFKFSECLKNNYFAKQFGSAKTWTTLCQTFFHLIVKPLCVQGDFWCRCFWFIYINLSKDIWTNYRMFKSLISLGSLVLMQEFYPLPRCIYSEFRTWKDWLSSALTWQHELTHS